MLSVPDIQVDSLNKLFEEPHCESPHEAPENLECLHKVVATIVFPCGCSWDSCLNQVKYSQLCKSENTSLFCIDCKKTSLNSQDIVILPRS